MKALTAAQSSYSPPHAKLAEPVHTKANIQPYSEEFFTHQQR
jgi:hypothetical protein